MTATLESLGRNAQSPITRAQKKPATRAQKHGRKLTRMKKIALFLHFPHPSALQITVFKKRIHIHFPIVTLSKNGVKNHKKRAPIFAPFLSRIYP
ncbi:hypothetical protein [Ereboglobus luteus]|uniref:hypothetical protein n=1 Tax=Ereboglobus luteus TaxID=1796921 RepID=UPI001260283B|nr:hypothetical protein [Ereboglobus luteus]